MLRTLDRLAELPERPEIVLVDNRSRDGTPNAVKRRHPHVRVVSMRSNAGASARNLGVRLLDSELAALSDDDSWWAPGSLTRAARAFPGRPRLGLIQGRILVGAEQRLDPTCAHMARSPLPAPSGLPGPAILGFVACAAVVRRSAFLGVGGFNERLGIGGEETLMALDLAAAGWELAYVDSVLAHHHPEPGGDRGDRADLLLRNELWTAWLRRRLPGVARTTARVTVAALRQRRSSVLGQAARGLPWVLRERRPLPPPLERAAAAVY